MQPRSYQSECVSSMWEFFHTNPKGNPLCLLPTGTGKSVVIALFIKSVFESFMGQRMLVLTHVKELVEQNHAKLLQVWPQAPSGVVSAGLSKREFGRPITFAGIGSVRNSADLLGHIDLVIVDEAHLIGPNDETMYNTLFAALIAINPQMRVIGFTATGWRMGQGLLTEPYEKGKTIIQPMFTDVCFDITSVAAFNRLIAEGFLAPLVPKRTELQLKTDGIKKRGGEFVQKDLQNAVDLDEITYRAVKEAIELGSERDHWLVFASGVTHAINVTDMLNMLGVPSIAIHSKMGDAERDAAIADFKAGKYRAAVNNNVLTTGFDFPAIDLILVLRPTESSGLWVQMLGRGTRPSPETGKTDCLVLDFANNTGRLGPINDPVIPAARGKRTGKAPVRCCDCCNTWNHASVKVCQFCGYVFPTEVKLKQQASTKELVKGDMPVVEVFKIDHVTYAQHNKMDRPPSMKVTYYCGLKLFSDFVCFEHEGFAQRKARQWWSERSVEPLPTTTEQGLQVCESLMVPTHLRVWTNKKYPEILGYCFEGTAFGTCEPEPDVPTVQTHKPKTSVPVDWTSAETHGIEDDDIPF